MLYSVKGALVHLEPNLAVVECGGVGYGIRTTSVTMGNLPPVGETVRLYTYLYLREDLVELFGFSTLDELNCFKMLISVSGVGPKAALSILSDVTPEQFAVCIASGDSKVFTQSKGVGAKTAQRIVLELRDKISNEQLEAGVSTAPAQRRIGSGNLSEAISALVVLGYPQAQAAKAVSSLDSELPVEELIKAALKVLAGKV